MSDYYVYILQTFFWCCMSQPLPSWLPARCPNDLIYTTTPPHPTSSKPQRKGNSSSESYSILAYIWQAVMSPTLPATFPYSRGRPPPPVPTPPPPASSSSDDSTFHHPLQWTLPKSAWDEGQGTRDPNAVSRLLQHNTHKKLCHFLAATQTRRLTIARCRNVAFLRL
jgi:hypothetical protein